MNLQPYDLNGDFSSDDFLAAANRIDGHFPWQFPEKDCPYNTSGGKAIAPGRAQIILALIIHKTANTGPYTVKQLIDRISHISGNSEETQIRTIGAVLKWASDEPGRTGVHRLYFGTYLTKIEAQ